MVLCFDGCRFIKTVKVPVSQAKLNEYVFEKPVWTIEKPDHNFSVIQDLYLRNDSIFGKLEPMRKMDHPTDVKNLYRRPRGPHSLSYMHLTTNETGLLNDLRIPLSGVTLATVHKKDYLVAALTSVVAGTAIAVGGLLIICNCPYVAVVGSDTTVFQGSLFPGAISKSLERSDNLIMQNVPADRGGNINIRISNELPEIEYFNQVELFEVADMTHASLGQHTLGHPVAFNLQDHLLDAVTTEHKSVKESVQTIDETIFDFMEGGYDDELSSMFLTFDKARLGNDAMLIVKAKQSKWMETVGEFTAQQFGTAFDNWIEKLDKVDPEKYSKNTSDRGISMNAYIKHHNTWEYIGSYANVGVSSYRTLALNVDLSDVGEDNVEIKLETAYGFWDLDYVGMTDEWSEKVSLSKLEVVSAVNHSGENVMSDIAVDDAAYTELPMKGDFIDMHFESPADPGSHFILRGKG